MNSNTTLIMFAVIAAFGLGVATLLVPIVPAAHAIGKFAPGRPDCSSFPGTCGAELGKFRQP